MTPDTHNHADTHPGQPRRQDLPTAYSLVLGMTLYLGVSVGLLAVMVVLVHLLRHSCW